MLRWGRYAFITPERLEHAEAFFARHGGRAVFLSRFVVGLRVFGALFAGTSRMPWVRFALYSLLGGTFWAAAAGLARLLSVGKHKPGRALGRPSFTPPGRCAGSRLAAALDVPESYALRTIRRRSARPRQPVVVNGHEASQPCNPSIYFTYSQVSSTLSGKHRSLRGPNFSSWHVCPANLESLHDRREESSSRSVREARGK